MHIRTWAGPLVACLLVSLWAHQAAAQSGRPASLRVTVTDTTGLVIVGAAVELSGPESSDAGPGEPRTKVTGTRGSAEIEGLQAGAWTLRVESPGFEEAVRPIALGPGGNEIEITLEIAGLLEEITVSRDPREAATDPRGDTMTVTISEAELDTLPDTAEELQAVLLEMAGPDAEVAVDGFLGGELPPKERILEIRIQRAMFSADRHWGGRSRIEIITRPGTERWRGAFRAGFRDDALNATNAFAPEQTPEQLRRYAVALEGPLVQDRTSLTLEVESTSAFESQIVRAGTPANPIRSLVRQPEDEIEVTVGVQHALTPAQMLRVEYRQDDGDQENLGVGTFDLPERGYTRTSNRKRLRLSSLGTLAGRFLNESRLELQWSGQDSLALSDGTTVRVLDSVTFGGANIEGGRRQRAIALDQKLEFQAGTHSVSTGGRFEWTRSRSDEIRNAHGTFTFSNPDEFAAGAPRTFSQRSGDPLVDYPFFTGGLFVQDDIRIRKGLSLGLGLRQEWQSQVDGWLNLSPRIGFSWAMTRDGRTTLRGGAAVFNEWYGSGTYEETLQVDGVRVEEITIQNPGYPDPLIGGDVIVLPNGRVQQASDLQMPARRQATLALERRLTDSVRVDVGYSMRDEINQLRGRNVNAPRPDGLRPDPRIGNVIEIRSIGRGREDELSVGGSLRLPWRSFFFMARYTYENERNDGDGPLSLPADDQSPDEWGPAGGDVRHRGFLFTAIEPLRNVRVGMSVRAQSAAPYSITTGNDDNGDTIFNDRPAGIGRHSARGDGFVRLDARLSWRLGFGEGSGGVRPQGTRPGRGGRGGNWREQHQMMSELYVRATNVLNTVALVGYSGVATSPFFGEATAARQPRRIEVGTRIMF